MGRYDEWFINDEDHEEQEEPNDSPPPNAPAETDKAEGSDDARELAQNTPEFSEIHHQESATTMPVPDDAGNDSRRL